MARKWLQPNCRDSVTTISRSGKQLGELESDLAPASGIKGPGFFECDIARLAQRFGAVAHVFSSAENHRPFEPQQNLYFRPLLQGHGA